MNNLQNKSSQKNENSNYEKVLLRNIKILL